MEIYQHDEVPCWIQLFLRNRAFLSHRVKYEIVLHIISNFSYYDGLLEVHQMIGYYLLRNQKSRIFLTLFGYLDG